MTNALSWLDSHYVKSAEYLLGIPVTLLVGVLIAAIANLDLLSRWLQRLAASIGAVVILLGGAVAVAKALRPKALGQLPWGAYF